MRFLASEVPLYLGRRLALVPRGGGRRLALVPRWSSGRRRLLVSGVALEAIHLQLLSKVAAGLSMKEVALESLHPQAFSKATAGLAASCPAPREPFLRLRFGGFRFAV